MIESSRIIADRIRQYLSEGKRFDGRKTNQFRNLVVETGVSKNAEGSARVLLGKTEVIVGIKMEVNEPYPDSPNEGGLMVTTELLPMSSSRVELGPPKFESIEIGRIIDRGIRESKFIDVSKLCIKEGEKAWTVLIDIYVLNDDGNLLDAAGIGAVAALRHATIPKYDIETDTIAYGESSGKKLPLSTHIPVPVTVHKIGSSLLIDPTREEEEISETRITISGSNGIISSVQKGNSVVLTQKELAEALRLAEESWETLAKTVEKATK